MTELDTITRRKLSDEVLDRLKAGIQDGSIAPNGSLPSERELMKRFGVGRPAIREALQALANLGLIVISHGERARVARLTPDAIFRQIDLPARMLLSSSAESLQHLLDARLFFERGMVRAAAVIAGPDDIVHLRALIAQQAAVLEDVAAFIGFDIGFHVAIARLAGNPIFTAVSEALLGWLRQYHTTMLHWSGNENVTIAEHTEIVDRLEARDEAGADAAMARHLRRSSSLFVHSGQARSEPAAD